MDFQDSLQSVSVLEWLTFITGIIGVWLAAKLHLLNFPVSLFSVGGSAILLYESKLYADALLQVYFAIFLIYGWYRWRKRVNGKTALDVSTLNVRFQLGLFFLIIFCGMAAGYFLPFIKPDAKFPMLDSYLMVISMVAQVLQSEKKIEAWFLWIVTDLIYLPLYWYSGLKLLALLYAVYTFLAIFGAIEWIKHYRINKSLPAG